MKANKIFEVELSQAQSVYTIFKECNVFTILYDGTVVPVYDFSGNNIRSTLNSLRKFFPSSRVDFYCYCKFLSQPILPSPYRFTYQNCQIYF